MSELKKILVSRVDNIGDVILTIPLCGAIKAEFPDAEIFFLGKNYTEEVIKCSEHISHFLNWSELEALDDLSIINILKNYEIDTFIHVFPNHRLAQIAIKAQIKNRIGTINRWYHLLTCNQLVYVSRKNSDLHEAELNIEICKKILTKKYQFPDLANLYGFTKIPNEDVVKYLDPNRKNIILHPRSLGSAREWGLNNFAELIKLIDEKKYNIIITGTTKEKETFIHELIEPFQNKITDSSGKLSLRQLISLIAQADALVAASTGPLHIASACGIHAIGLYIMTRPMHPGRWRPIGKNADVIVYDEADQSTDSITKIPAAQVYKKIQECFKS
jgi:ADP-heptose:LPS heptosyltransferase